MDISGLIEKAVAGRWIAGAGISDAVALGRRINTGGASAIFNYLGEDLKSPQEVDDAVETYLKLIDAIGRNGMDASISLKPTELGIDIGRKVAEGNYSRIVRAARRGNVFVWMDMESHRYVDPTIALYRRQLKGGGVGICIQSYLRRSGDDLARLVRDGAVIRLVKGAYTESRRIAFGSRTQTTANYYELMKYLFKHSKRFMIATHDQGIIDEAQLLNRSYRRDVTYAMLNGIRNRYAMQLARISKVALYVPFGRRWFAYSYRRLKEEGHLMLILRSILEDQSV